MLIQFKRRIRSYWVAGRFPRSPELLGCCKQWAVMGGFLKERGCIRQDGGWDNFRQRPGLHPIRCILFLFTVLIFRCGYASPPRNTVFTYKNGREIWSTPIYDLRGSDVFAANLVDIAAVTRLRGCHRSPSISTLIQDITDRRALTLHNRVTPRDSLGKTQFSHKLYIQALSIVCDR